MPKLEQIIMKSIILSGFSILLSCFLLSCMDKQKKDDLIKQKLEIIFHSSINKNTQLIFKLDTITDFKWDNFIVLPPYTNLNKLSNKINIDLGELKGTSIEYADNKTILLFVKSNNVFKYVEFPRFPIDFAGINDFNLYTPENSTFKLSMSTQMGYYIIEEAK